MQILEEFPEIGDIVKKNVEHDYFTNIKLKVMAAKEKHLDAISKRFDYQNVLTIMPKSLIMGDPTKVNHNLCAFPCSEQFDEEYFHNL